MKNEPALAAPGPFTGGWRYSDVRFLANADLIHGIGGRERWLQDCSPQSLQPRTDLLPDPARWCRRRRPCYASW